MLYKLGKKLFKYIINFLKLIQVSLIFLSFATILYWILELGKVPFATFFTPFFSMIKDIVHLFYNRVSTIDNVSIDFAYLIAALSMLLIVWVLKFVVEYTEIAEAKYDSIYKFFKKKSEILFNLNLEKQYRKQENKNNKLIIFVKFSAKNLEKNAFFDRNADAGIEGKRKEFLFDFYSILDEEFDCQKKLSDGGVFLYFDEFKNIDALLSSIEDIITNLRKQYFRAKWQIDFLMSLDVYATNRDIAKESEKLLMLIGLGLENKIACLSTFKHRYSLIKTPSHLIEGHGVYKMLENEDVFCIEKLK